MSLRQAALKLAIAKIGTREVTDNWGPEIKQFLAAAKIYSPAPWCAGFVNWCAEQAAKTLGVASPLEQVPTQGYCPSYAATGKKLGWVVAGKDMQPGDLFVLYFPSMGRYAHIGFCASALKADGTFETVEGNTNADGGREGNVVARRVRRNSANVLFLRYSA